MLQQAEIWFEIIAVSCFKRIFKKYLLQMKNLLNKEYYCYQTHTSLVKSSAYQIL